MPYTYDSFIYSFPNSMHFSCLITLSMNPNTDLDNTDRGH